MQSEAGHTRGAAAARSRPNGAAPRRRGAAPTAPESVRRVAEELAAELVGAVRREAAAGHRDEEVAGARDGGPFAGRSWYDFALEYSDWRWRQTSAKTRSEVGDALCALTEAMVRDWARGPDRELLRRALLRGAFVVPRTEGPYMPDDERAALRWVEGATRSVGDLLDPDVMKGVISALSVRPDGSLVPGDTQRHRKNALVGAVRYAFGAQKLSPEVPWPAPRSAEELDPRRVINPGQARSLLTALSYVGPYDRARGRRLVGFFAGMYYAGLRPEEAVVVRYQDCELPSDGWGRLVLHETRPQATKKYTDSGRSHDERGLKSRKRGAVRVVPLPPQLVALWRESFDTFGTAEDGRLFFTERKRILGSSGYCKTWHDARVLALPPDLVASPLARRPYDLRHSALSTWLNAGVDPTEVAERAGNTVETLLRQYAKCLYGRQTVANSRIEKLLEEYG